MSLEFDSMSEIYIESKRLEQEVLPILIAQSGGMNVVHE